VNAPAMTVQRLESLLTTLEPPPLEEPPAAAVGATVEVEDVTSGRMLTYRLVEAHEASPVDGRLSVDSPVGAAVRGLRPGEVGVAATPRGERALRVISVT
jgi:transcription elongation factor GreA